MTSLRRGGRAPGRPEERQADAPVQVTTNDGTVSITLVGHLDGHIGEQLVTAVDAALSHDPRRIDIDLRKVKSFTTEGADALVTCRDRCALLTDGLHYRTGRGASQKALLAAYQADRSAVDSEPAPTTTPLR